MILTVTPNSAIDRVIFVRDFQLGGKVSAESHTFTPAGKGVGASLTIHELGGKTLATGLAAGRNGQRLRRLLGDLGISHEFVPGAGETRMSIVLVDLKAVRQSTISVDTLSASEAHVNRLAAVLDGHASQAWGVAFGGSLPNGLPLNTYDRLVRRARELGLFVLLDSSGEALRQGITGLPHVLKVNQEEIGALDPRIARQLRERSKNWRSVSGEIRERIGQWASDAVIVTLGDRGVLAVTLDGAHFAQPPHVPAVNTAGAGDALTGGLMLSRSRGASWPDALALGTAAAASAVMNRGTGVCRRDEVADLLSQVLFGP